ncbi:MAG: preprotein translocase subunit YajC [Thermoguttaceae bacterium]
MMLSRLGEVAALLAEGATGSGTPAPDAGPSSMLPSLLPLLAIFVLFYFLLIRPQRREQSRRQAMLAAVKKNDRVVTAGGIYGVVTNVHREADEVTVKVDEATNTKLRMTLSSVTRVLGDEPSDETANKSS